jgi:NADPH:quinone reductase-like Zn-dependent oxidoreductase
VYVTASANDREFLLELGADSVIDYKAERFEDIATDIDLVLDLIGGETQTRSWSVVREGGTIISSVEEPDEAKARAVGAQPGKRYTAHPSREDLTEIAALIDTDVVTVVISERFTLDNVEDAQSRLEKDGGRGKILVTVS